MMRESGEGTREGGSRVTWRGVLLVCAVLLGACRDPAMASGTALYVTTEFDPTLLLTQVRVWGTVEGGQPFGPHVLPEQPDRLLYSGETLRVLLGDAPNGAQAKVSIEGLRNDVVVARGESTAQIRDGYEVEVTLHLEPATPDPTDGGTDGGFCPGCDGCCVQSHCTRTSFNTCGTGGIACVACDPVRANACDARGVCVCGSNAACAPGQACVSGTCRCSPNSCSGCCAGNLCTPGNTRDQCGKGGETCRRCSKSCNADRTCS